MANLNEGWTWMWNARKWHYFTADGRSLCRKWLLLSIKDLRPDEGPSIDDCIACRRKLEKSRG